jgi:autophagy-related protein 9
LRQENYLIALFNKDLLDLRVRLPLSPAIIPFIPSSLLSPITTTNLPSGSEPNPAKAEKRFLSFGANTLTKALEWNLRFCLMGFLFDGRGQVRREFVKERKRKDLVEGSVYQYLKELKELIQLGRLKRRFVFMGVLNAIFAPFIVVYLLVYSFFRYFEVSSGRSVW